MVKDIAENKTGFVELSTDDGGSSVYIHYTYFYESGEITIHHVHVSTELTYKGFDIYPDDNVRTINEKHSEDFIKFAVHEWWLTFFRKLSFIVYLRS